LSEFWSRSLHLYGSAIENFYVLFEKVSSKLSASPEKGFAGHANFLTEKMAEDRPATWSVTGVSGIISINNI
jgi:hypothetical protein